MKTLIQIALPTLMALALGVSATNEEPQDNQQGCSICAQHPIGEHGPVELSDGLQFRTSGLLSKVLVDPQSSAPMIVLALHCEIAGAKAVGFRMDMLEYVDPTKATPLEYNFGGVSPEICVGEAGKGKAAHNYHLRVAHKAGKLWIDVKGTTDIEFLPIRVE